jgi:hypothetical protein
MEGNPASNPNSQAATAQHAAADSDQRALPSPPSTEGPDSEMREQETKIVDGAPAPPMASTESPRRPLKLVLTLTPGQTAGYLALLALGSDGCDPVMRSVEVADLSAALQEVAALVAAAEARWQFQPRNAAAPKRAGTKQRPGQDEPPESGRPAPDGAPAQSSDQLPLFG